MSWLLVMVGGALGAVARHALNRLLRDRLRALPGGTLAANVVGSLLLGLLTGAGSAVPGRLGLLLGAGFCGALTTYSTFAYETVQLADDRGRRYALLNVAVTVVAGCAAVALGRLLA